MSAQALALVLLAGLIHAGWNILAKKTGGDARFAFFTSAWLMAVWAPLGLWLGWRVVPAWGAAEWAVIGASALLHVVYFVTLLRGYRAADLTVVYPLARGTGPLLSSIGAVLLLGEAVTWGGVLGVLGVVLGVVLIAGGARLWRPAPSPVARQQLHRGLYYGLLTGVWIAGYTVVDGYAVKVMALSPILVDYMGNALRVLLLAPVARRAGGGAVQPGGLCAGALRRAAGAAVARGAGARGVDAVCRADRRKAAGRGRPGGAGDGGAVDRGGGVAAGPGIARRWAGA